MLTDPNEVDPRMIEWFNNNVLMGFTEDREKWAKNSYVMLDGDTAKPWFANENYQGAYTGPVPIEAVETLFKWKAVKAPLFSYIATDDFSEAAYVDDAGQPYRKVTDDTRRALLRSDTGDFLNVVSARYGDHQYQQWLVENVAAILDDELAIGSAGLLMGGGVAWVSVELPETITTEKAGFPLRTRLLAFTSHNGKYKTSYKLSAEAPVCSNSLDIEVRRDRADGTERAWSTKHTSNSGLRIAEARQALSIIHRQTEEMVEFVDKLAEWEVTNKQFVTLMDRLNPLPETVIEDGKVKNQRAITMASNRRRDITTLYAKDDRAAPWMGTALGVLQAFNTYDQQESSVRGQRVERQMLGTLGNEVAEFDAIVLNSLAELCEVDLVAVG